MLTFVHIHVHYELYLQTAHCCYCRHRSIWLQLVVDIRPRKLPRWLMERRAGSGFPWKRDILNRRAGAHLSVVVDLRFLLDIRVELRDVGHVTVWLLAAGVAITVWGEDEIQFRLLHDHLKSSEHKMSPDFKSIGLFGPQGSVVVYKIILLIISHKKTTNHIFAHNSIFKMTILGINNLCCVCI